MTGESTLKPGVVYVESYPRCEVNQYGHWVGKGTPPPVPMTQVWDWCRRHPNESVVVRVGRSAATWRPIPKEHANLPVVWQPLSMGRGEGVWLQTARVPGEKYTYSYIDGTPFTPDRDDIDKTLDGRSVVHIAESLYADQPLLWNGSLDCITGGSFCVGGVCPVK